VVEIGAVRSVATKTERHEVLIFQLQKLPHVEPSEHSARYNFKIVQLESLQVVQYDSFSLNLSIVFSDTCQE
jgi:hypothetical protein